MKCIVQSCCNNANELCGEEKNFLGYGCGRPFCYDHLYRGSKNLARCATCHAHRKPKEMARAMRAGYTVFFSDRLKEPQLISRDNPYVVQGIMRAGIYLKTQEQFDQLELENETYSLASLQPRAFG